MWRRLASSFRTQASSQGKRVTRSYSSQTNVLRAVSSSTSDSSRFGWTAAAALGVISSSLYLQDQVYAEEEKKTFLVSAPHPLDPLSGIEIAKAVRLVKEAMGEAPIQFESVALDEPEKSDLKAHESGQKVDRIAFVTFFNKKTNEVYEARVSVKEGKVIKLDKIPGRVFTAISLDEIGRSAEVIRKDPQVQEALRKRGIKDEDFDKVHAEPWSAGYFGPNDDLPEVKTNRLTHAILWISELKDGSDNRYAHPIEGLNVVVDLASYKVIRVIDRGVVPVPGDDYASEYATKFVQQSFRKDLKPLEVIQPEGPSFTIKGHSIEWQKWNLRVGFNPREGLTLHQISYKDGDVVRPIIHRASISEMVVPYLDPTYGHYRKNAFDAGEYGLGRCASSLTLGCDCLGVIHYFDAWLNDSLGVAYKVPRAICIHEEDTGLLWRHWDYLTNTTETRRRRRLVISFVATVGNYDYAFYWYFYQDGDIQFEAKATGILNTASTLPGYTGEYGTMVAPGVYAPNHEHMFNVRLHMNLDGDKNSVAQVDTERRPCVENGGNAILTKPTVYETEKAAQINPQTHRVWKIFNPSKLNRNGTPVAYQLAPFGAIFSSIDPNSWVSKRAPWIQQHVYVTPYHPNEKYPSGQYVLQSQGDQTINKWLEQKRNVKNTDIVVWHTIGLHHLPRLEDWPMNLVSAASTGFTLHPSGFFNMNPTIDVPPQPKGKSVLASESCCTTTNSTCKV